MNIGKIPDNKFLISAVVIILFMGILAVPALGEEHEEGEDDDGDEEGAQVVADDLNNRTPTSYPDREFSIPIAFLGSDISVNGGNKTKLYKLLNTTAVPNKTYDTVLDNDINLSTSSVSEEGRYVVYNENDSKTVNYIDLVSNASDVRGRINASESVGAAEIVLRRWLNNSKIDTSGTDINISNSTWQNPATGGEDLIFRMNISGLNNYWIGVNTDKFGSFYTGSTQKIGSGENANPTKLGTPHVNDIGRITNSSSISGRIVNRSDGDGIENLTVRVRKKSFKNSRFPFFGGSPIITNMTDSQGYFNITGLPATGRGEWYFVDVTNDTHVRTGKSLSRDLNLKVPGAYNHTGNYTVTPDAGTLNGTIDAPSKDNLNYGVLALPEDFTSSFFFIQPFDDAGSYEFKTIPSNNYTFSLMKVDTSANTPSFDFTSRSGIGITDNSTTSVDFSFPEKTSLTGIVKNSTGHRLQGAQLSFRNFSKTSYPFARTDSTGNYTAKLINNTGYKVRVEPPENSDMSPLTTTINASKSSDASKFNVVRNFTLSKASDFHGYVTYGNGNGVEGFISVYNGTQDSFGESRTNASGYYKIDGLEANTTYYMDFYEETGGGEIHVQRKLNFSSHTENLTLETPATGIDGYIKNSSENGLDAKIILKNRNEGSKRVTSTDSNGYYNFKGTSRNSFYRIEVKPSDSKYKSDSQFIRLQGNKTVNLTLPTTATLSGTVLNGNNNPITGAEVIARNSSTNSFDQTETDSNGDYSLDLESGLHDVKVEKESYPTNVTNVNVTSEGTTQNVTLSKDSSVMLYGNITESTNPTNFNGSISIWNDSRDSTHYQDFQFGEYNFTSIKNITYNVWVKLDSGNYSAKNSETNTVAGLLSAKDFDFTKNRGKTLNISVSDSGGNGLGNATVSTGQTDKETDMNGFVTFGKQPTTNPVTINVNLEGYESASREINVTKPDSISSTSVRKESFSLSTVQELEADVNVTDSNGDDVQRATVTFVSNSSDSSRGTTSSTGGDGETTIEDLVDGGFLASLSLANGNVFSNETYIKDGKWETISFNQNKYQLSYNVTRE